MVEFWDDKGLAGLKFVTDKATVAIAVFRTGAFEYWALDVVFDSIIKVPTLPRTALLSSVDCLILDHVSLVQLGVTLLEIVFQGPLLIDLVECPLAEGFFLEHQFVFIVTSKSKVLLIRRETHHNLALIKLDSQITSFGSS